MQYSQTPEVGGTGPEKVWMIVRFFCVIRVLVCARVPCVVPVGLLPGSPRCLFTGFVRVIRVPACLLCKIISIILHSARAPGAVCPVCPACVSRHPPVSFFSVSTEPVVVRLAEMAN